MNLVLNAIEAMKDTAGELTMKSRQTADGQVLVSVSDTGVGPFNSEFLEKRRQSVVTTRCCYEKRLAQTGFMFGISRSSSEARSARESLPANCGAIWPEPRANYQTAA